ncbi:MAG: C40 family peptidase [Candidatus Eisenbacteria bacterium]|nr:C40 family peptidase [Candidatus Eisenbacteria bacterium]
MSPAPTHGVVCGAALDLRVRPEHRAELGSQLLLGEVVRLAGKPRKGWLEVEGATDGYRGWVREWGLLTVSATRARAWQRHALGRVAEPITAVRARPGAGIAVSPLFFGSCVIAGPARRGARSVELPDGRRGFVPAAAVRERAASAVSLEERALSLLGAPYLWGGRTPAGYDCSAFVQQVLAEQGVRLPRDAHEQYLACRALRSSEQPAHGDLAFFRAEGARMSHVGLALGEKLFVHSRGWVRVSSLDPDNPLCDKPLIPQFCGWFRPRRRG